MSNNRIYLPNGMEAVEAEYLYSKIPEYDENPFISSLPELKSEKDIIRTLANFPNYNEDEIYLDKSIRMHILQRLYQLFQPLPKHLEIWDMINTLIRQGYVSRNPFDAEYRSHVNKTGKEIINRSFDINSHTTFRTTASAGTIIGYSGMGKTTTVNRVLNQIPQVIVHNSFDRQHFNQIQLSYLRLEAPHNSSLKALTLQFFMKIDELLGTDNFKRYVSRNLSVDAMLPMMGQVAHNIGLGLIILDELQHLNRNGARQIMNYFVTLINSFGVPIVFIGTPESYDFLQNEFRISRRVSGNGEVIWNNMENNSEFSFFLESIWRFQWLRKKTRLNDEIIKIFYDKTQGVSDLIIKLFLNAQIEAIKSGKEEITVEMIKKVSSDKFKLMEPMLEAMRSKNPYKALKYHDLAILDEDSKQAIKPNNFVRKDNRKKYAKEVKLKDSYIGKTKTVGDTAKRIKVKDLGEEDIRRIIDDGNKEGKGPYETLLEQGMIDNLSFLEIGDVND